MTQPTQPVRSSSVHHPHYEHYYGREGISKFTWFVISLTAVACLAIAGFAFYPK